MSNAAHDTSDNVRGAGAVCAAWGSQHTGLSWRMTVTQVRRDGGMGALYIMRDANNDIRHGHLPKIS